MDKIITYNFNEDFISRLADYIEDNFIRKGKDLSRLAVVFGGKRPALFLKRELARRVKSSLFPPRFFAIDQFIRHLVSARNDFRPVPGLDAAYIIYNAAKEKAPLVLRHREKFSQFLPWAKEIADFIDEIDLENIDDQELRQVEESAHIGYEVPESINKLLGHIVKIRSAFHAELREKNLYSRGLMYLDAASFIKESGLEEFDNILLCNFFYLHKTEEIILKHLYEQGKAVLFFQKDERKWPVFDDLSKSFGCKIEPPPDKAEIRCEPKIYKGFDSHSQVGLVREILVKQIPPKSLDKTLIVLSDPNNLMPLLSEVSSCVEDFNVSLGYSLKRSPLYSLFRYIFQAQSTRKGNKYYTKDYLKVLLHPLIKNLDIAGDQSVSRVLCHKVEEVLQGMFKTAISGSLFVELDEIQGLGELYMSAADTLLNMDIKLDVPELKKALLEIHGLAFGIWEDINNFGDFLKSLERFNEAILNKSPLGNYPLNIKIIEKVYESIDELKRAEFKDQPFAKEEIFNIFDAKLQSEAVSFQGSPLKGLQILGLFETRSLSFENVIVMDANESVLPRVRVCEPLIPRQVMEGLGLERLKQDEEIQRYHFLRLISGARNVYFVYDDNLEKERSRFIEEIIWQEQKRKKTLNVLSESRARFNVNVCPKERVSVKKDKKIVEYLSHTFEYSPSSVDTYLNCPLKFYYLYVLKLEKKEELLDDLEGRDIGNFIHAFLDRAFRCFLGKKPVIDSAFEKKFFEEFQAFFDSELERRLGPGSFMVRDIMEFRLKKFLDSERARKVKKIISLEDRKPAEKITFLGRDFKFKYRIDRVDQLEDGSLLVIDYKTGGNLKSPAGLNKLKAMACDRASIRGAINSFQLPVYYYFTSRQFKDTPLNAALYNLRDIEFIDFIKSANPDTAKEVMDISFKALEAIVSEIVDPGLGFQADSSLEHNCEYCPFSVMCK
ncbi:MAG: PD-(D/E)XK nuclease family protein [Candidatus Omnitrophota bacterium]